MINWKIRIKSKEFWLALFPAVLVLAQTVLFACGIDFDPTEWTGKIIAIVDSLFLVLAILGIINDPTVVGFSDSKYSMLKEYPTPKAEKD